MKDKCHFIGIGGIGMSGLARIVLKREKEVTGSDLASSVVTEGLQAEGAHIFFGQEAKNISPDMTVIYSSDIKRDNPEFQAAIEQKCRMLHRSDFLSELMKGYKTLSVAGTHGKTTTSSLLAWVLSYAGLDPAFAVGGVLPQFTANAKHGDGEYFVAEADESDGTFLKYQPFGAIVTNIGLDHMDHYGTEDTLIESFEQFFRNVSSPDHIFWCGDDPRLLAMHPKGISYGFGENCTLRASRIRQKGWNIVFDASFAGREYLDVEVSLIGQHNALNALAVFGLALTVGADEGKVREALQTFQGVGRRCEKKGESHGVLVLDDYAHHPTEIKTTLDGIRQVIQERRLIAIFQPHRYTRTRDCLGTFEGVFDAVDELIITDVYAAREQPIQGVSHVEVIAEVHEATPTLPCEYIPREDLPAMLAHIARPHDVFITLGAGDITRVSGELAEMLQQNNPRKLKVGLVCGGRSVEREISIISSQFVRDAFDPEIYEIESFEIGKDGRWLAGEKYLLPGKEIEKLQECDLVFPMLHGSFGEDGTIQGLFEMLGKPYVGCNHRAAAVAMDKGLTKAIVAQNGIPTLPFTMVNEETWDGTLPDLIVFPVYVKPAHLGSSVGISEANNSKELNDAIQKAFRFDNRVLVEKKAFGREIEIGVLGNSQLEVLPPAELCSNGRFCDFKGKYGEQAMTVIAPPDLPEELLVKGRSLAEKAYRALGCSGWARIDFFLDSDGTFWLNEVNPIPGCTPKSGYPAICKAADLPPEKLVDRLCILALEKHRHQQRKEWERP